MDKILKHTPDEVVKLENFTLKIKLLQIKYIACVFQKQICT